MNLEFTRLKKFTRKLLFREDALEDTKRKTNETFLETGRDPRSEEERRTIAKIIYGVEKLMKIESKSILKVVAHREEKCKCPNEEIGVMETREQAKEIE